MKYVATLVANPQDPRLDDARIRRARQAIPVGVELDVLHAGVACDLHFLASEFAEPRSIAIGLRIALDGEGVDVVVQRESIRRKHLLVADMDSTLIGQECIDELADVAGLRDRVAEITERAMRGELEFEPALRERVALLEGLPAETIDRVIDERITLTPGAQTLVRTFRAKGGRSVLVSGGFTAFAHRVGAMLGVDEMRANILEVGPDGRLTGRVREPILGREAKADTLLEQQHRLFLDECDTLAVGDGANDLAMLRVAGLGVAYRAKPLVAAAADARIDHGDLTALLYIQGYRREEFAEEA